MSERWRKPVGIIGIESDASNTIRFGNDPRLQREYEVIVDHESFERMRTGRICAMCYEPFQTAWPEICTLPGCGFRVRDEQLAWLQRTYGGETWVGSRESLSDELEQLDEKNQRRKHNPDSRIVVPSWVNLD